MKKNYLKKLKKEKNEAYSRPEKYAFERLEKLMKWAFSTLNSIEKWKSWNKYLTHTMTSFGVFVLELWLEQFLEYLLSIIF